MRRVIPGAVALLALVALVALASAKVLSGSEKALTSSPSGRLVSSATELPNAPAGEAFQNAIHAKAGSRHDFGEFRLRTGRAVGLYSVDTTDGKSCLVDDDTRVGPSAGCLEGGLFRVRRAAFSVNSTGGPGRFEELYVIGVAAPGIRAVDLVRSDGSRVRLDLSSERAFLVESTAVELEARIHPAGLRLYAAGGQLVETISFPPLG